MPFVLAIRVKPGAARTRVGGVHAAARGPALVVAVSAPAVDGRATEAAIRAVAEALGLAARQVSLRTGATSRDKLLTISDPPADLPQRLARLYNATTPPTGRR
jgi:uncharacterized protein YggU (UPF0235/DUF167 family)